MALEAHTQQKGDICSVRLEGALDETVDLAQTIGTVNGYHLELNLKGVTRINSQGVRQWMRFVQSVIAKGVNVRYLECSPAFVEMLNLVMSLGQGVTVDSIQVPYYCAQCGKDWQGVFRCGDIKRIQFNIPPLPCPSCQSIAELDDVSSIYFAFLQRK